jgi:hypothetical protein
MLVDAALAYCEIRSRQRVEETPHEVKWIKPNDLECESLPARSDPGDLRSLEANAPHQALLAEDECIDIRTQIVR